jgi:hypothetical protein
MQVHRTSQFQGIAKSPSPRAVLTYARSYDKRK